MMMMAMMLMTRMMIIGKSALTSLISQCGLWLRLCLPYCLVTHSLFTIQCILHCQPLQCLYTAQCILHIAYFMYTTQCTLNNNVHTLQDTEVHNLPKKAADSNGSTLLSNWQHNQPQWLHRFEERFHQVEESFTDRRWLTKSWVQCSFWVATVQTVCCAVYTSGGALLDTQLGRGGSNTASQEWVNDKVASAACLLPVHNFIFQGPVKSQRWRQTLCGSWSSRPPGWPTPCAGSSPPPAHDYVGNLFHHINNRSSGRLIDGKGRFHFGHQHFGKILSVGRGECPESWVKAASLEPEL